MLHLWGVALLTFILGFFAISPKVIDELNPMQTASSTEQAIIATSTKSTTQNTTPKNPATSTPKTTPLKPKPTPPPAAKPQPAPAPSPLPTSTPPPPPPVNTNDLNSQVRAATVNILCSSKVADATKVITGTGVVIDPRGVILTNAHVAQYLLLENYGGQGNIQCDIRTGSPAYPTYRSKLLYIPKKWVEDNKQDIIKENPVGTGENDFALLLVTGRIDNKPLESLPFISAGVNDSDIDQTEKIPHVAAAYPAGFLGGVEIQKNLYASSIVTYINHVFTFNTDTVDLIALGGNVLAQKGASGGAVVSSSGKKLVGLVVTTSEGATTGERDLHAITLSHVNRSLKQFTGESLSTFLSDDLMFKMQLFYQDSFPYLSNILIAEVSK